jgi:signal transduction histidine kinase
LPLACMVFLVALFWYLTMRICLDLAGRIWRARLTAETARRVVAENANQAKAEFLANMSHEIRAPLNAIVNFTEQTVKSPLSPEIYQSLGTVRTSADWLIHIVNDVLEFAREEAGTVRLENAAFSVQECISSAFLIIQPEADTSQLVLKSKVSPAIPAQLCGDFTRLLQVIFNLVENAVKGTTSGGVTVSVEPASCVGNDITLRFSVSDTGFGMPPEQLKDLFQPLTHPGDSPHLPGSEKQWMASAFGLAICQKIVERMGGSIEVQSHLGAGTTISFTAQFQTIAEQQPASPSLPTASALPTIVRSLAILVADENAVSRHSAKTLLESAGHVVYEAAEAAEVLELISRQTFDLVLMEMDISKPDGLELTRAIRLIEPRDARTPIYAVVFSATPADRERCRASGIDGLLPQPLEIESALNIIAAIALRRLPARPAASGIPR